MNEQILLSIIIPYYNSSKKCGDIIDTLKRLNVECVEVIFVDDGSDSEEHQALIGFCTEISISNRILKQNNKGPGGARNSGLIDSHGKYIWFVDSDDNINPEAIEELIKKQYLDYDFIDFQIEKKGVAISSMGNEVGEFTQENKISFEFGRMVTKIFKKSFLAETKLFFPEYCIYEDNYVGLMIRQHVKKFFCSDLIGYFHNTTCFSVTRTDSKNVSDNYYDRLFTGYLAFKVVYPSLVDDAEREYLLGKFRYNFFIVTFKHLIHKNCQSETKMLVKAYCHCLTQVIPAQAMKAELKVVDEEIHAILDDRIDCQEYSNLLVGDIVPEALQFFKAKRDAYWETPISFPEFSISSPKKLYIHIGTHKTGTTSIQHNLRAKASTLLSERTQYIEVGKSLKKLMFATSISDKDIFSIRNEVISTISDNGGIQKYIMSWEGFCGDYMDAYANSSNIAKNLYNSLSPFFEIKIIVYLREQTSFLESIFTQEIHAGAVTSFNDFNSSINNNDYSWSKLLKSYSDIFGVDSLIVKKFDKSDTCNLISEFSSVIGSTCLAHNIEEKKQNVGYNKGELEFALRVNSTLDESDRKKLRAILQENSKIQEYSYFSIEEKKKIYANYHEDNSKLNTLYKFDSFDSIVKETSSDENIYTAIAKVIIRLDSDNKKQLQNLRDKNKCFESMQQQIDLLIKMVNKSTSDIEKVERRVNISMVQRVKNKVRRMINHTKKILTLPDSFKNDL